MKNIINKPVNLDAMAEARKSKKFQQYYKAAEIRIRFAIEVYNCRIAKGLNQQKLAKMIGSTQKVISKIENGDVNIGFDLLNRLAECLNFNEDNWARIFKFSKTPQYIIWKIKSNSNESENNFMQKEKLKIPNNNICYLSNPN